CMQAIQYPRTF
nr:immunoglobulin light chain junction region [Macaca mulatta]MOW72888.1 immunoglobulin light chain junction region [Macaca mulatta]MOW73104.1 immunoglobulin light chain junction region [Macaca mulatta]MOW73120.1 immunoglobulin light chain junction region [Macaca mulatta]MOW73182.1 immunoglobulin light chain junction region [Macaca mulatta]